VYVRSLIEAIDQATPETPISVIYYLFTANNETGMPLIHALRRAANRRVPIRVLTTKLSSVYLDRSGYTGQLLADRDLLRPVEFIEFGGGSSAISRGLNISDSIHEKAVIVGDRYAFFGTGNIDGQLGFMDLSYAVRPIDRGQESLLTQLQAMFDDRWTSAIRVSTPRPLRPLPSSLKILCQQHHQVDLPRPLWPDALGAIRFINTDYVPGELRPHSVQLITNDFLEMALLNLFSKTIMGRSRMPDDIVDMVLEIMDQAPSIDLVAMIFSLSKSMQDGLKQRIRSDLPTNVYTNSRQSSANFVPMGISYLESLMHILDLLTEKGTGDSIRFSTMQPDERWWFSHLKLLRTPDTVVLGSTNFNVQSTARNSELAVVVRDRDFSTHVREYLDRVVEPRFKPLNCETALLHYSQERTLLKRIVNAILRVFY
jgi:phosphatidylserine/phosphatidylglycerophosphate/cardiolipin synthase-like enzyme